MNCRMQRLLLLLSTLQRSPHLSHLRGSRLLRDSDHVNEAINSLVPRNMNGLRHSNSPCNTLLLRLRLAALLEVHLHVTPHTALLTTLHTRLSLHRSCCLRHFCFFVLAIFFARNPLYIKMKLFQCVPLFGKSC